MNKNDLYLIKDKPETINILVSCPSDVETEKKEIIRLCKDFTDANYGKSNINFHVLDWKNHVGEQGIRLQQQLKEYFGVYDIYIGILWKRFGTPPGSVNASGKENESGTEEEFYDAIEYRDKYGRPRIHFFIKTIDRTTNDLKEHDQLGRVLRFIEEQQKQNNNFLNYFDSKTLFNSLIVKLLKSLEHDASLNNLLKEKKHFVGEEETQKKIANYNYSINIDFPETLIKRSTTHFKFVKETLINPLLETKQESLDQLMVSAKRVVLLGDAGSGKSTELKNLHYRFSQDKSPFIPILQNFNSYTPDVSLEEFLPDFWKDIPSNLLLIIWDGLDEIEPKNFNTVVRRINTFSEKHKEIRILISCRRNFYELPVNDSNSTLQEFEPYYLNDLTIYDVKSYYERKFSSSKSEKFLREIFDNNLSDLITKPFFLMLLADLFNQNQKLQLNRVGLYEMFLVKQIEFDKNHFNTTVDLRSKRQEITLLLEKIALSMEILSRNQIEESDILQLISSSEFELLKYSSAFRKKDGEENLWHFVHNNIQEFLAAKALSSLDFNKLVKLIAYAPNYKKLIPNWVNTLTFLFSILDSRSSLFEELLKWIVKYEKEVIVKFEPDKITDELRVEVFQEIFNYYKNHDVWISYNKFNYRELARFGQSNENIKFLIQEINSKANTRTVRINAINLIEYFIIEKKSLKKSTELSLLKQIDDNDKDINFVYNTIYALANAQLASEETIKKLMNKFKARKNQYIRASMYSILSKSDVIEDYKSYIIQGIELIDNDIREDREDTILMDESLYIKECFKGIKSSAALQELIGYIIKSRKYGYGYIINEAIKYVLSNAIEAYKEDISIYNTILKWYEKDILDYRFEKTKLLLEFFNQTNTLEKAFHELWDERKINEDDQQTLVIARLLTPNLLEFIINEYQHKHITKEKLERIFLDIGFINHENCDELQKIIQDRTDIEIKKPEQINYEALRKERMKVDFDLLFDQDAFIKSTKEVFEKEKKDVLSSDELFEMRKEGNRWLDIDEYYPSVVIRLLRDFVRGNQSISKGKVLSWFENKKNDEWYRISSIYNYLSNNKELEVNSEQRQWIEQWCVENVSKVDFKKAIEVHENGRTTFKTMAMYIWYFSKRFNIDYQKNVLLDMLSFDFFEGQDNVGIDHITSKLEHKDIVNRMLENIKEGIADSSVLKNHIKYLAKNKVEESYSMILNETINLERNEYKRKEFLDLFFYYTNDTESIKGILNKADSIIKWDIIDKLRVNSQENFVEKHLLSIIRDSDNNDEIGKASEALINLQNIEGLKSYVSWIKNKDNRNNTNTMCLNNLKTIEAIPYLIELLEFSYKKEDNEERFNSLNSSVLGAFHNIALVSSDNFEQVKTSLQQFITKKSSIHKNVKHILFTIEKIEEQFYMNKTQSLTIKDVKEKLKLIE